MLLDMCYINQGGVYQSEIEDRIQLIGGSYITLYGVFEVAQVTY